ncbi:glucose-1-phosphate cytidylyltransferase [Candidatus Nitrosopumilus sediminis]|uniref:Glucose-1-phosphate cytidylyltransferase n=1 Tax=Candidatus Nitrosopumilus sediminis TaxID=1229909 RepID=K0BFD3_9ARCH|nr:glucose-1-phosphate cytidylyltransferase [Candidatus Nitrosopumilus sediminis]AFS83777.1 glucose-1-phosphate cytidylyltransferase [Candidatus Nitrosopumilus sediminis]
MKAVILAGGYGTRIEEETYLKPKPMIEIGGKPILWHIMKIYSSYGINDFVICLGYKGYMIKEYFANYFLHNSDVTIDIKNNKIEIHQVKAESWKVTLVDTGENTMTGGRINRIKNHITDTFCLTYGDGVSDIDINKLIDFHKQNKSLATLTAVQPPGRYGALSIKNNKVKTFHEKPLGDLGWINGGFFVFEKEILNYINNDETILEAEPLEKLASEGQLSAFMHYGFWRAMDTLKDKKDLEKLWQTNNAQWKIWQH